VNSQEGSAIATGTIRGGQLAVGRDGRVHVVWNGSDTASPRGLVNPANGESSAPFLYARSSVDGNAFETQRNVTRRSYGIDGGGSIAADAEGHVYAAWHGLATGGENGEDHRLVWVARSDDEGATFGEEQPAWREPTGACGCCGLRLFSAAPNRLFLLYRSATALTHRDMYLLESRDNARSFRGGEVQPWNIGACPMTSMSIAAGGSRVIGAWETAGQVYFGDIDVKSARIPKPIAAPGDGKTRKHPRVAISPNGDVLFVWTEGAAWARGGSLAWQLFASAARSVMQVIVDAESAHDRGHGALHDLGSHFRARLTLYLSTWSILRHGGSRCASGRLLNKRGSISRRYATTNGVVCCRARRGSDPDTASFRTMRCGWCDL
jgi:hypothetical protein